MIDERPLPEWLAALPALLQSTGVWQLMEKDAAGVLFHRQRVKPD